ncbi:MAG: hypothetical protein ACM337_07720 [Syntrophaceae bacterium]
MKKMVIGVLAVMLVLPIATGGWATETSAKPKGEAEPASWKTDTMVEEITTVVAIDQSTRMVTLKTTAGKEITFKAGDHVRNLPQVQVGDEVKFTYYESLAVRVLKKGEEDPASGEAAAMARAKTGEKPAGVVAKGKTVLATIESIDKKAKTATLKGENGNTVTVTPRDPERLDQVKVGDRLVITHTEAIGVKVEKLEKKKL